MLNDKNTRFGGSGRRYRVDRAERCGTNRAVNDKEESVEIKGPDVETKSIVREPIALTVERKDNAQEENPQPPSQDQEASIVKSANFPHNNKKDTQSSFFPVLKYNIDESETTKEHLIEICKVVIEEELDNKSLKVLDINSEQRDVVKIEAEVVSDVPKIVKEMLEESKEVTDK